MSKGRLVSLIAEELGASKRSTDLRFQESILVQLNALTRYYGPNGLTQWPVFINRKRLIVGKFSGFPFLDN